MNNWRNLMKRFVLATLVAFVLLSASYVVAARPRPGQVGHVAQPMNLAWD